MMSLREKVKPGVSSRQDFPLFPDRTALLIIDIQQYLSYSEHDYFNADAFPRCVNKIELLTQKFRQSRDGSISESKKASGSEVIWSFLQSATKDGRDISLDYKLSGQKLANIPVTGTPEIFCEHCRPDTNTGKGDILLPKTSCSVFQSTNLNYLLRNLGIEQLVIAGQLTDQCIESAVRDAADLGYFVTVVEDACAANSSAAHQKGLQSMKGFSRIIKTEQVLHEMDDEGVITQRRQDELTVNDRPSRNAPISKEVVLEFLLDQGFNVAAEEMIRNLDNGYSQEVLSNPEKSGEENDKLGISSDDDKETAAVIVAETQTAGEEKPGVGSSTPVSPKINSDESSSSEPEINVAPSEVSAAVKPVPSWFEEKVDDETLAAREAMDSGDDDDDIISKDDDEVVVTPMMDHDLTKVEEEEIELPPDGKVVMATMKALPPVRVVSDDIVTVIDFDPTQPSMFDEINSTKDERGNSTQVEVHHNAPRVVEDTTANDAESEQHVDPSQKPRISNQSHPWEKKPKNTEKPPPPLVKVKNPPLAKVKSRGRDPSVLVMSDRWEDADEPQSAAKVHLTAGSPNQQWKPAALAKVKSRGRDPSVLVVDEPVIESSRSPVRMEAPKVQPNMLEQGSSSPSNSPVQPKKLPAKQPAKQPAQPAKQPAKEIQQSPREGKHKLRIPLLSRRRSSRDPSVIASAQSNTDNEIPESKAETTTPPVPKKPSLATAMSRRKSKQNVVAVQDSGAPIEKPTVTEHAAPSTTHPAENARNLRSTGSVRSRKDKRGSSQSSSVSTSAPRKRASADPPGSK